MPWLINSLRILQNFHQRILCGICTIALISTPGCQLQNHRPVYWWEIVIFPLICTHNISCVPGQQFVLAWMTICSHHQIPEITDRRYLGYLDYPLRVSKTLDRHFVYPRLATSGSTLNSPTMSPSGQPFLLSIICSLLPDPAHTSASSLIYAAECACSQCSHAKHWKASTTIGCNSTPVTNQVI